MIKSISVEDFRGITRMLTFHPGVNVLIGPNEARKSTVGEALCFGFYGYDSSGTKNPDHLISIGKATSSVAVQTTHATIVRRKKRGAQSTIKLMRDNMPDVPMTQTELSEKLGIDFDVFASAAIAGYFMRQTPGKKMEIVAKVFQCDRKVLFEQLALKLYQKVVDIPSVVKFDNVKASATYVANERRKIQNVLSQTQGRMTQMENQKRELDASADMSEEDAQAKLSELSLRASSLTAYGISMSQHQTNLSNFNALKLRWETAQGHIARAKAELQQIPADVEGEASRLVREIADCEREVDLIRSSKLAMPAAPKEPKTGEVGTTCHACGQPVSEKAVKSMVEEYNRTLLAYNTECRQIADENAKKDRQAGAYQDQIVAKRKKYEQMTQYTSRKAILTAELTRNQSVPHPGEQPLEPACPVEGGPGLSECQQQIQELQKVVARATIRREGGEKLKKEYMELRAECEKHGHAIQYYTEVEQILSILPEEESKQVIEMMQIDGASVRVADGDVLVFDKNECPYTSLSSGRKAKADIELCKVIQRNLGGKPGFYFIDNEDLIDDVLPLLPKGEGEQVFIARVDSSLKDLEVRSL